MHRSEVNALSWRKRIAAYHVTLINFGELSRSRIPIWEGLAPDTRNHVTERELEGERAERKYVQSTSRVKGHQTCKRYSLQTTKDTAISLPYSEIRSFEGSESTFSVDRRYAYTESVKTLGLFDLDWPTFRSRHATSTLIIMTHRT